MVFIWVNLSLLIFASGTFLLVVGDSSMEAVFTSSLIEVPSAAVFCTSSVCSTFSSLESSFIFANPSSANLSASTLLTSITTPSGNLTPLTIPDFNISTLTQFSVTLSFSKDLSSVFKSDIEFSSLFTLSVFRFSKLVFLFRLNSFFVKSLKICTLADKAASLFILFVSLSKISFTISATSLKGFPFILSNNASLIFRISGARFIITPIFK